MSFFAFMSSTAISLVEHKFNSQKVTSDRFDTLDYQYFTQRSTAKKMSATLFVSIALSIQFVKFRGAYEARTRDPMRDRHVF